MTRVSEALQRGRGEMISTAIAERLRTIKRVAEAYGESDSNTKQPRKTLRLGKFTADVIEPSPDDPIDTYTVVVDQFSSALDKSGDPKVLAEVFLNSRGDVWGHVLLRAIDSQARTVREPKRVRRGSCATAAGFFPNEFGGASSPGQRAKAQDALLSWTEEMATVFRAFEQEMEAKKGSIKEEECMAVAQRFDRIAEVIGERVAKQKLAKMPVLLSQRLGENPNAQGSMGNDTLVLVTPGQTFAEDRSDFLDVDICRYHENARSVIAHYDKKTGMVTHTNFTESYDKDAIRAPLSDFTDERRKSVLGLLDEVIVELDSLPEPVASPQAAPRRKYKRNFTSSPRP